MKKLNTVILEAYENMYESKSNSGGYKFKNDVPLTSSKGFKKSITAALKAEGSIDKYEQYKGGITHDDEGNVVDEDFTLIELLPQLEKKQVSWQLYSETYYQMLEILKTIPVAKKFIITGYKRKGHTPPEEMAVDSAYTFLYDLTLELYDAEYGKFNEREAYGQGSYGPAMWK